MIPKSCLTEGRGPLSGSQGALVSGEGRFLPGPFSVSGVSSLSPLQPGNGGVALFLPVSNLL